MMINKEDFALNLRDRRIKLNMSQPQLAKKANVSMSTYVKWEKSDSDALPDINEISEMAKALNCQFYDLVPGVVAMSLFSDKYYTKRVVDTIDKYISLDEQGQYIVDCVISSQIERVNNPDVNITIKDNLSSEIKQPIFLSKTDDGYAENLELIKSLKEKKKKTGYSYDMIRHLLAIRGYNGLVSIKDIILLFKEVYVPSSQLYHDIEDILDQYIRNIL